MAGDDPRRATGALSEVLRLSKVSPSESPTEPRRVFAGGSVAFCMDKLFIALRRGEGGRDDPGVLKGDTALEPGSDASWNPSGEPGAVEGGEPLGVGAAEEGADRGSCREVVEAVETMLGRSILGAGGL